MKTLTSIAIALALAGAAAATSAADRDESALSACRSELQQYYGEEVRIDLVSKRRYPRGTRMKLAAHVDADNRRFATCWVDSAGLATIEEKQAAAGAAPTERDETPPP